ncbi:THAP domain-containing protein 6 [Merluccius polli]|uniref:THAP domain-containing protein 6 n=1 Tax=Merluccius polli TaxID=89951 RepID=A0AA47M4C5_MERPO|nr:THAP domain-containing protein 6 [Merluccius polli]
MASWRLQKKTRMPGWYSAYSCSNERAVENRNRGITFTNTDVRKKWEVALRREGFTAMNILSRLILTGQIVRLRDGVIPSLFSFPVHLQKLVKGRATSTSRRAEESLSVASKDSPEMATSDPQPQPNYDHGYALPASPTALKAKINEHLARVESLERDNKNAMSREKRAKTTLKGLLGDLREKNLINEELSEKLAFYSDLKMNLSTHRTAESLHSRSIYMVQRHTLVFSGPHNPPSCEDGHWFSSGLHNPTIPPSYEDGHWFSAALTSPHHHLTPFKCAYCI